MANAVKKPGKQPAKAGTTKPSKAAVKKAAKKTAKDVAKAAKASAPATYRKPDEVRDLILTAAQELFAERTPADVSIRDIAARAGVQHSLVHRHFDTKDRLLAEVIIRVRSDYAEAIDGAADPAQGFERALDHLTSHQSGPMALVNAVVGDAQPPESHAFFPGFSKHYEQFLAAGAPDDDHTRMLAATLMALVSGWGFLEDFLLRASGLDAAKKDEVRAQINRWIELLIDMEMEDVR